MNPEICPFMSTFNQKSPCVSACALYTENGHCAILEVAHSLSTQQAYSDNSDCE